MRLRSERCMRSALVTDRYHLAPGVLLEMPEPRQPS